MIPPVFDYHAPAELSEVLHLLGQLGGEARVLAGGQSLLPLLKLRVIQPQAIIDLHKVRELAYVRQAPEAVQLGAMTTDREIERSRILHDLCPLLVETVQVIGDPHIRNLATVGGSVCQADPQGDLSTALLALNARVVLQSARGSRTMPLSEFIVGPLTTALQEDEVLTRVEIRVAADRATSAYLKMARRAGDFAVVGAAVMLWWDEQKRCKEARIALCGVGPKPVLLEAPAAVLRGTRCEDAAIAEAARRASAAVEPYSDPTVSAEYRRAMAAVLTKRAIAKARQGAEVAV